MRIAAGQGHQQRDRGAERRDLREREVDEDDAPLDDVHAEVGVDAGQDQAGDERRGQKANDLGESDIWHNRAQRAPVFLMAATSRLMS